MAIIEVTIHKLEESLFTKTKETMDEQIEIQSNDDCFFFSIWGIIKVDWMLERQTVNQDYCKGGLDYFSWVGKKKRT